MMAEMESKKGIISGKLSGTRSLISDLESIENPDEVLLMKLFIYRTIKIFSNVCHQ